MPVGHGLVRLADREQRRLVEGAADELAADGEAAREAARPRLVRAAAVEPPVPYPEDSLSYLANV